MTSNYSFRIVYIVLPPPLAGSSTLSRVSARIAGDTKNAYIYCEKGCLFTENEEIIKTKKNTTLNLGFR